MGTDILIDVFEGKTSTSNSGENVFSFGFNVIIRGRRLGINIIRCFVNQSSLKAITLDVLTVANRQVTEEIAVGYLPRRKQLANRASRQVTEEVAVGYLPRRKQLANRAFRQVTEEVAVGSLPRRKQLANRAFRQVMEELAVGSLQRRKQLIANRAFRICLAVNCCQTSNDPGTRGGIFDEEETTSE